MHRHPPTPAMLDVADEVGLLIENEGSLGSVHQNVADPRMWENYKQMMTYFFNRDKNHPSMILWSMVNEILHCIGYYPDLREWTEQHLLELGQWMQALDPTRPIEFNGDGDLRGNWSVMNLHYPRKWWRHPDLPNSAFWLYYGAEDLPKDTGHSFPITWNQPKPIVFGEDGIVGEAGVPHDFTSLGGEEVYQFTHKEFEEVNRAINDQGHAPLVEGYRVAGVSRYIVQYGGGGASGRVFEPVRFFIRERDTRFYSDEIVPRHVSIHNDTLHSESAQMEFAWRLANNGKLIAQDTSGRVVPAGELRRLVIDLPMPAVDEVTPVELRATLRCDGRRVFSETYKYTVYPRRALQVDPNLKLGVFDRAGDTARALSAGGLSFRRFGMETFDAAALENLNCLLVGENGFDPARMTEFHQMVAPFLKGGGTLIVLRQDDAQLFQEDWMPDPALHDDADAGRNTTISWPRWPSHPALRGLDAEMLRYWRGDNIVSTGDFVKAPAAGWRPLVDSGGPGGLRWTSLVEMPVGRGTVLVCQMHLAKKLNTEPAARIVLENLLNYAATHDTRPRLSGGKLCLADSRFGDIAGQLAGGLAPVSLQSSDQLSQLGYIVVEADVPVEDPAVLADYVQGGGRLLLHGLTPENLPRWQEMLPVPVELEEVNSKRAVRLAHSPLLRGISGTELWWGDASGWSLDHGWEAVASGVVEIPYACQLASSAGGNEQVVARELVKPGGLLEIEWGRGLLVIDQLSWETETAPARARRYAALLLTNLAEPY